MWIGEFHLKFFKTKKSLILFLHTTSAGLTGYMCISGEWRCQALCYTSFFLEVVCVLRMGISNGDARSGAFFKHNTSLVHRA
ncbi:hypothetical protein F5Y14DRAFT_414382 [Nemania sp. NC0429]|nr:hypothetical protein F5Y14DRAFT_414382 [Nemania sp. NC0429]